MTESGRLKLGIGLILSAVLLPTLFLLLGGPERLEAWALQHPESDLAEWMARKVTLVYKLTLRTDKYYRALGDYVDTFDEDAEGFNPDKFKKMLWEYAWETASRSKKLEAGKLFYYYWELFPDDEDADRALDLAKEHGFRPRGAYR